MSIQLTLSQHHRRDGPGLRGPAATVYLTTKTLPSSQPTGTCSHLESHLESTPEKACLYLRGYVGHGLTCQQRPLCTLVITPIGSAPEGSFHAWLPAALSSWQLYISIECTPTSSSMQLLPPELTE